MKKTSPVVSRRRALQGAASILGGTIAASQIGGFMARAAVAADEDAAPTFFDRDQFALLERMIDLVIPETDTPGALGAGVHHFIDMMMSEWAAPDRQKRFVDGLETLQTELRSPAGEFIDLPPEQQLEHLRQLDAEAYAPDAGHSFFREFKRLVLFGYYSSEAGATIELQYEPLTPDYKACVPINDIGRAWFWLGFSHGL